MKKECKEDTPTEFDLGDTAGNTQRTKTKLEGRRKPEEVQEPGHETLPVRKICKQT